VDINFSTWWWCSKSVWGFCYNLNQEHRIFSWQERPPICSTCIAYLPFWTTAQRFPNIIYICFRLIWSQYSRALLWARNPLVFHFPHATWFRGRWCRFIVCSYPYQRIFSATSVLYPSAWCFLGILPGIWSKHKQAIYSHSIGWFRIIFWDLSIFVDALGSVFQFIAILLSRIFQGFKYCWEYLSSHQALCHIFIHLLNNFWQILNSE